MTKNVITGICGFVASHLADMLLSKGEEVYGTYRWTENQENIKHLIDKNPNFHMVPMDLNDLTSCIKCMDSIKPDYVYHLGAQSYVTDSYTYPIETIRTNTLGTLNLLEAIRIVRDIQKSHGNGRSSSENKEFDPIVHVCSSSEVYGLVTKEEIPITEKTRFNPSNPYAVGKVGADMVALMYFTNYGIKTIRTRMFTHTGPRRLMMSAENYYAKYIAEIENGKREPFIPLGNMQSVRTWADVRDAVRAYYALVRQCKPGEVYNIGGKTSKTIQEVLDFMLSISTYKGKIEMKVDPKLLRPYDVTLQIPDCSKFLNETGWEPEYTFEQTMTDLLNFWRERTK